MVSFGKTCNLLKSTCRGLGKRQGMRQIDFLPFIIGPRLGLT